MPLDTIYLTRHGHRLTFTVDPKTGKYHSQFPTPTDNPADPILTSHGVQQSHELAAHISSPGFHPKPFRIYSSPYYRCLQTIKPAVEKLRELQVLPELERVGGKTADDGGDGWLHVKVENGVGEWFGPTSWFHHPTPSPPDVLSGHFPNLLYENINGATYKPVLVPSTRGETITQLHNRLALALAAIIADLDHHISIDEESQPESERTSKAVLICSHAASLIAMGRVLTGNMPNDSGEEDFNVFTAGLSTFKRRSPAFPLTGAFGATEHVDENDARATQKMVAPGTETLRPRMRRVPEWEGGRGVGGGWDCVGNGDCSFLSGGAERGWHFNGDESFDPAPGILASDETPATKL